jgi:hypothetical protein
VESKKADLTEVESRMVSTSHLLIERYREIITAMLLGNGTE